MSGWFTIEKHQLSICKLCGSCLVYWMKNKSGKFYLAQAMPVKKRDAYGDRVYLVKANEPHFLVCKPGKRLSLLEPGPDAFVSSRKKDMGL